jgi:hypothetical protein
LRTRTLLTCRISGEEAVINRSRGMSSSQNPISIEHRTSPHVQRPGHQVLESVPGRRRRRPRRGLLQPRPLRTGQTGLGRTRLGQLFCHAVSLLILAIVRAIGQTFTGRTVEGFEWSNPTIPDIQTTGAISTTPKGQASPLGPLNRGTMSLPFGSPFLLSRKGFGGLAWKSRRRTFKTVS